MDKTTIGLLNAVVFFVGGLLTVWVVRELWSALAGVSLFNLYALTYLVCLDALRAKPAGGQETKSDPPAEKIPTAVHKALAFILMIVLSVVPTAAFYYAKDPTGASYCPLEFWSFTVSTWIILWLFVIGLVAGVGLGGKPSPEAAIYKNVLVVFMFCWMVAFMWFGTLLVPPPSVEAVALCVSPVHLMAGGLTVYTHTVGM